MTTPNPNLVSVWSPDGKEMAETSRLNAYDLVTHAGWSYAPPRYVQLEAGETPPAPAEKAPADEVVEAKAETETPAAPTEVTEEAPAETETGDEDDADEAPAVRKTEEDFADLTERDDVVAYLAATFPDFKPHHLSRRDTLVAKAIELANG